VTVNLAQDADLTGWHVGLVIVLAYRIAGQARRIDAQLRQAERNTAPLAALTTTIEHAETIVAGLERGRHRLGG
jgi:hypothetical protein